MTKPRKRNDWSTLSIPAFRELASRITSPEVASALARDVDAALRRVDADLAEPLETDAERYPGTPAWRERAGKARDYLAGKLRIVTCRALALGGLDEVAIEEMEERTEARRRDSRPTLGGQLASIARDVAALDPLLDVDGGIECISCERALEVSDALDAHAPGCVWRRAVELVELHPSVEGDLAASIQPRPAAPTPKKDAAELEELRRQVTSLRAQLAAAPAKLGRKYERQLAHGERMGRERDHYRRLLRVAMRALALSREVIDVATWGSVVAPEIERIRKEDSAVASPGFLADVRLGHESGRELVVPAVESEITVNASR